ncbi:MAG: hypothetical protein ACYS7Y_29360 [Planctomycetota bacterium]|jgi:hypothetical protein
MTRTEIVDRSAMESMIAGFNESEFALDGFECLSCERQENNHVVWKFSKKIIEREDEVKMTGRFRGDVVVHMWSPHLPPLHPGDTLNLTYSLTWFWRSDGDNPIISPDPFPGACLYLQFQAA